MSDIYGFLAGLSPEDERSLAMVSDYLSTMSPNRDADLRAGLASLTGLLQDAGYLTLCAPIGPFGRPGADTTDVTDVPIDTDAPVDLGVIFRGWATSSRGNAVLRRGSMVLFARQKTPDAVLAKMRHLNEPLGSIFDQFGYRIVVADEVALDRVAHLCQLLWYTPSPVELSRRDGQAHLPPWRDYRRRDDTGWSAGTSTDYDQAIHLSRVAPFGIVEIQLLTLDLFDRTHGGGYGEDRG